MPKRSVVAVVVLTILTLGLIYPIIWFVKTKGEMVKQGADIPTAWLLLVPIASIYWFWKWSGGVEHATRGKLSQVISLILVLLLGVIGMAIIQAEFNKVGEAGQLPQARVA
jgi:hypothetical protein